MQLPQPHFRRQLRRRLNALIVIHDRATSTGGDEEDGGEQDQAGDAGQRSAHHVTTLSKERTQRVGTGSTVEGGPAR